VNPAAGGRAVAADTPGAEPGVGDAFERLLSALRSALADRHARAAEAWRDGRSEEARRLSERAWWLSGILREAEHLARKWRDGTRRPPEGSGADDATTVTMIDKGARAVGILFGRRIVVRAGSTVRAQDKGSLDERTRRLRERCRRGGILLPTDRPGLLRLPRDLTFDSPSAAARFVGGCSLNGPKLWRRPDGQPIGHGS